MNVRFLCVVATAAVCLTACGGGGRGGGGGANNGGTPPAFTPPPPAPLEPVFIVPAGIERTEDAGVGSNPVEEFVVKLPVPLRPGTLVGYSFTQNGILNLGFIPWGSTDLEWNGRIDFEDPSELGPGVYTDTFEMGVCADESCTALQEDTVATFTITYTVTGQKPPPGEVVASTKSLAAEAMGYTDTAPEEVVELSYLNVQPNASFSAEVVDAVYLGVNGVDIEHVDETSARIRVRFKTASTLRPGIYDDVITVTVCAKCPRQVVGSPLTIQTRYTVVDTAEGQNGYSIQVIDQAATDLVWDAASDLLYLTVPSSATAHADSVVALDPRTAEFGIERGVDDFPVALAVSDDGRYLYSASRESDEVQRLNLPDLTPSLRIPLPGSGGTQLYPVELAVAPTAAETLAVVVRRPSVGASEGVLIFDDEVQRPNAYMFGVSDPRYRSLQWSGTGVLYASAQGGDLSTLNVDVDGVALSEAHHLAQTDGGRYIRLDQGNLYLDSGARVDPSTYTLVGSYLPPSDTVVRGFLPDSGIGRAYALIWDRFDHYLQSYDLDTYEPIATVPLHGIEASVNGPIKLVRWGDDGLALATWDNKVVIVRGPFVGP